MFLFSIAFVYCVRTMATGGDHESVKYIGTDLICNRRPDAGKWQQHRKKWIL